MDQGVSGNIDLKGSVGAVDPMEGYKAPPKSENPLIAAILFLLRHHKSTTDPTVSSHDEVDQHILNVENQ